MKNYCVTFNGKIKKLYLKYYLISTHNCLQSGHEFLAFGLWLDDFWKMAKQNFDDHK
jgi:hypothetical protein